MAVKSRLFIADGSMFTTTIPRHKSGTLTAHLVGGRGSNAFTGSPRSTGGGPGSIKVALNLPPGTTVYVVPGYGSRAPLGGAAFYQQAGFGPAFGGQGGSGGPDASNPGGGGGASSDIRLGGTGVSNRIVVAGGGGGGAGGGLSLEPGGQGGGYGGQLDGETSGGGGNGQGATTTAAGVGASPGTDGGFGEGGDGGDSGGRGGGGGGGGWYGGGGGDGDRGQGGGGSAYYDPTYCTLLGIPGAAGGSIWSCVAFEWEPINGHHLGLVRGRRG